MPEAFLAPFRFDELEGRVAQVVRQTAVRELDPLKVAHRGNDVGDRRVPDGHEIERIPVTCFVIRKSFVHPEREGAAEERAGNDVEFEDVRLLMGDEAIERVGGFVNGQDHPVPIRLGEGQHALGQFAGVDILFLKFAFRLVDDERNLEGQVVLQVGADLLICALCVARDPLEMDFRIRVIVDLEMIRWINPPLEMVVFDPVLAEIGDESGLGAGADGACQEHKCNDGNAEGRWEAAPAADAHGDHLWVQRCY